MTTAPEAPTGPIVFDTYETIREALFDKDLSRTFDRRSWDEGNIRDGVVSIQHGAVHRARRRVCQHRRRRTAYSRSRLCPAGG